MNCPKCGYDAPTVKYDKDTDMLKYLCICTYEWTEPTRDKSFDGGFYDIGTGNPHWDSEAARLGYKTGCFKITLTLKSS